MLYLSATRITRPTLSTWLGKSLKMAWSDGTTHPCWMTKTKLSGLKAYPQKLSLSIIWLRAKRILLLWLRTIAWAGKDRAHTVWCLILPVSLVTGAPASGSFLVLSYCLLYLKEVVIPGFCQIKYIRLCQWFFLAVRLWRFCHKIYNNWTQG